MTVCVSNTVALAIVDQCEKIRGGDCTPPSDPSWVEEEPGIWVARLPDPVSVVYYHEDGRVEVEVGDYCLDVVSRAGVVGPGVSRRLLMALDSGFMLSCPVGEVDE